MVDTGWQRGRGGRLLAGRHCCNAAGRRLDGSRHGAFAGAIASYQVITIVSLIAIGNRGTWSPSANQIARICRTAWESAPFMIIPAFEGADAPIRPRDHDTLLSTAILSVPAADPDDAQPAAECPSSPLSCPYIPQFPRLYSSCPPPSAYQGRASSYPPNGAPASEANARARVGLSRETPTPRTATPIPPLSAHTAVLPNRPSGNKIRRETRSVTPVVSVPIPCYRFVVAASMQISRSFPRLRAGVNIHGLLIIATGVYIGSHTCIRVLGTLCNATATREGAASRESMLKACLRAGRRRSADAIISHLGLLSAHFDAPVLACGPLVSLALVPFASMHYSYTFAFAPPATARVSTTILLSFRPGRGVHRRR